MTKSYITHLSTIVFAHVVILLGTWQLSQSEYVRTKVGNGVMKLQLATNVILNNRPVIQNTRVVPVNPTRPKVTQVEEKQVLPVSENKVSEAEGSEFGTSKNGKKDLLSVYKAELRARIDQNKYYPPLSRRLGQTGTVVVAFTLLEDGNIIDIKIDKPSRYERLNESALDAVKKVEKFKPIPKEIGELRMDIKVPVKFFTI